MSTELRRKLRQNSSPVERRFWRLIYPLRSGGWHFRKQVELGPYYVDFTCLHAGLVVEVDGFSHDTAGAQQNDELRNRYLQERGFSVLRFSNSQVLENPEGVYAAVIAALKSRGAECVGPPPQPYPRGGGCQGGGCEDIEP